MKKSFDGTRIQVDLCWTGASAGLLFISGATISTIFLKGSCYELSVGYRISRQSVSFSFFLLFILFLVTIITSFILFLVIQNSLHFTFRRDVWPTYNNFYAGKKSIIHRNDIIFNKKPITSFMQAIFYEPYWFRF